jgi:DsbC/DsbD-like thiol-disulfide interchange protein
MPDALTAAKQALAHADKAFPSTATPSVAAPKVSAATAPSIGQELAAKKTMVDKAMSALPKMHNGGPVKVDGSYQLKAGEHVLTEAEAKKARKHALMASGMKSLAKPSDHVKMAHAKSTLETASKFKATKPAPSNAPPADTKPGTVDAASVAKLNAVSERVRK